MQSKAGNTPRINGRKTTIFEQADNPMAFIEFHLGWLENIMISREDLGAPSTDSTCTLSVARSHGATIMGRKKVRAGTEDGEGTTISE